MSDEPMRDDRTTVRQLRDMVRRFVEERAWQKYHAPKNVAMALAIEAAELMEHFQWLDLTESRAVAEDAARREAAGEELADVVCYALALANELNLDLAAAMQRKMRKNEAKYPIPDYHGRYEKPTD